MCFEEVRPGGGHIRGTGSRRCAVWAGRGLLGVRVNGSEPESMQSILRDLAPTRDGRLDALDVV